MGAVAGQLIHQAILPLQIGLHGLGGIIGSFVRTTIAVTALDGEAAIAMRQRQTGGDPRQRPAGKQLHRFTGQGRHLRHRVAGQQTAAAGHHVSLCGRDHIQGLAQLRAR